MLHLKLITRVEGIAEDIENLQVVLQPGSMLCELFVGPPAYYIHELCTGSSLQPPMVVVHVGVIVQLIRRNRESLLEHNHFRYRSACTR